MPALSIVIPAHNERDAIAATLERLGDLRDRAEVVVVCNGCTDDTAGAARAFSPHVAVVEIDEASKPAALRRGDDTVSTMPRLYLDADVLLDAVAVRVLMAALDDGPYLAVSPTPRYTFDGAGWLVRGHYRIWSEIQKGSSALSGTGAILLSSAGRARFARWPDVIGDDYFVSGLFEPEERARVPEATVTVVLPTTLRDCVSRKARVHQGNLDVEAAGLRRVGARGAQGAQLLEVVRASPRLVIDLPGHVAVTIASRLVAAWRRRRGTHGQFHRGRTVPSDATAVGKGGRA